jgi:serine/threonine-protein kinase
MELDDLKSAWQMLDRRLEQQATLNLHVFRQNKLERAHASLRPLVWGQVLQILAGIVMIVLPASFWSAHLDVPHLFIAGLSVHIYGVLMTACAGVTLGLVRRIDYAAPVLTIQKQLARLRQFYVRTGTALGLAWWVLWLPVIMMFFMIVFRADLYVNVPWFIYANIAVGAIGLLATLWFYRWARDPRRPRLGRWVDDTVTGTSLRRAQGVLDEIARFEQN